MSLNVDFLKYFPRRSTRKTFTYTMYLTLLHVVWSHRPSLDIAVEFSMMPSLTLQLSSLKNQHHESDAPIFCQLQHAARPPLTTGLAASQCLVGKPHNTLLREPRASRASQEQSISRESLSMCSGYI